MLHRVEVHLVGESIPRGTTTALGILAALGYDEWGKVSSVPPSNPHELKERVVRVGLKKSGLKIDEARQDPMKAVAAVGDPVHISIADLLRGALEEGVSVILAGGNPNGVCRSLGETQ